MNPAAASGPPPNVRLRSLDAFRGATIALMILVNNAGDWSKTYAPLLHAEWHGWTPTDLVFPFFLFILGVAIPFALGGRRTGDPSDLRRLHRKILRRSAILFTLGLLLNWFPFFSVVWARARIPGVLQRIAVVYLVAALAYLHLRSRGRVALALGLLAGYWAAMKLVPVPGFGAGDLSPAGNLAFWLDHRILGAHTWRYAPGPGDPEGILSTLPAIASGLAGVFVGDLLRSVRTPRRKLRLLFAWGAVGVAAGLLLQPFFPINKNLWSPTYVVFTSGAALLALGAAYALIDLARIVRWARPFEMFGTNAIAAYVGSGLLVKLLLAFRWTEDAGGRVTAQGWLYSHLYAAHLPDYVASLAWALSHVAIWWLVVAVLDRRGLHLKV